MDLLSNPPAVPVSYDKAGVLRLLAGMLTAGAVAAFVFPLPHGQISWPQLFADIAEQAFTVSIICAATVCLLSPSVSSGNRAEFLQLVRRASTTALWLAPLALFLQQNSIWIVGITAVLAVTITSTISRPWNDSEASARPLLTSLNVDAIPLTPTFGLPTSVLTALCVQIGLLTALGSHLRVGAFLVAFSVGIWTWVFRSTGENVREVSASRSLLTFLVVTVLMAVGLFPYLRHGGSPAGMVRRGILPHLPSGDHPQQPPVYIKAGVGARPAKADGEQGIVLWGEPQKLTKLVAPTPITGATQLNNGNANPLVIPFAGVYWFFKSPDLQPPAGSREAHAAPDAVEIRSTDRRPLSIEAHDHLANLIDLDCCSRIQIAIRNADRYPETVLVELTLINTSLPHSPSVTLGRMMVNSTPAWNIHEKPAPVAETLTFQIPPRRLVRSFDAVKIVFLLDRARADAAARIAIDHFVLIPRGL